ncbi:MAG: peptidase S41 [Gammaproteobacteria bacterium RIFCSPHIGHO2_12_FULL_40_19]|nr:MAG: peptidase S41 [Gammaproteobacteria bacterium RIFCSPHIGHO2_12_FULL_40_19]
MKLHWKKISAGIAFALLTQSATCSAFSLSFLNHAKPVTASSPQTLSADQLKRLTESIVAIQENYITKVDEKTLIDNAISGMVTRLDPHSAFLDKQELDDLETTVSGEFVGIGVELTTDRGMLRIISPIEGTPAAKAGLKPGDLIVKVDDKLIQDMTVNEAINHIKGKPGTPVVLTLIRKDEPKPLIITVNREVVKVKAVQSKMLSPGYGYVRLAFFQGPVEQQTRDAIETLKKESGGNLKGFILDLRNNPGGLLDVSADVVDLFLTKDETKRYKDLIVYTKGRISNSDTHFYAHDKNIIPGVPMVVLINSGSASASEIVAGALQDYKRAIIVGTRSFGKGSVQTVIPIGANNALKLTTALYYTPSGREIQARGIEPDVIVPEFSVDEKQMTSLLDIDEANYDRHIENHTDAGANSSTDTIVNTHTETERTKQRHNKRNDQQKSELKIAKEDYQMYQALMMLKGAHALR